jgi:hypothetical protein
MTVRNQLESLSAIAGIRTITTTSLDPGVSYALYSASSRTGPFTQIATLSVPNYQRATITVPRMSAPFYKLETAAGRETTPPSTPNGRPD